MSESVHPDHSPKAALAVAERYAGAVNYLYPLLINVSHKHRIVRDRLLSALFDQDRIWPTHKLLRKSSVRRAKRKLASFAASGDFVAKSQFLGAWLGHARHANTNHLLTHMGVDK